MKKKVGLFVIVLVLLALPLGSARAEDLANENYLNMEQQLQIVSMIKGWDSNMAAERVAAYDPAKLQISCPLPIYAYKDGGFVEVGRYLPLLFAGEPLFFIVDHENGYGVDSAMGRWFHEYQVSAAKPLAVVFDYDGAYVYDGADWLLLHRTIDAHLKMPEYDKLDTQNVDTSGLPLTQLRPVLSLENAYFERFPGDEDITIYFNGQKQAAVGWLTKGRPLVPLRDICDLLGVQVEYNDAAQKITLHNRQDVYTLRLNERGIQCNGHELPSLAMPVRELEGRAYLPLRDLARILQIEVEWDESNLRVDLQTDPQALCGVVRHVLATMENWDLLLDSPVRAQELYTFLWDYARLDEVAAPPNTGRYPNLDIPDFYYLLTGYDFLLADGSSAHSCELYLHVPGQPLPEGYSEYLLLVDDKWYNLESDTFELLEEYHSLPDWQRID